MTAVLHALAHLFGLDDGGGAYYLAWSGFVGDVGIPAALAVWYRRHNCHARWCWRFAHFDTAGGDRVCRAHHPERPRRALTAAAIHHRHHAR